MINAFEFGVNILEEFIITMFLTLYFGCKYSGCKKTVGFLACMIISTLYITYFNFTRIYEGLYGLGLIIIYFLYAFICLKGNAATKAFISALIDCIVSIISVTIISGEMALLSLDYQYIQLFSAARIINIALAKVLLTAVCIMLSKFRLKGGVKAKNCIAAIALTLIAELSIEYIMSVLTANHNEFQSGLCFVVFAIATIITLAYYLFIKSHYDAQIQAENAALRQKFENDKQNARDIEELYNKVCGTRHDLLNHFTTISRLLDEGSDKAQEYIKSVTNNQLDTIKALISTGNDCFDAIVNTKIALCESYGITVRVRAMENAADYLTHDEIAVLMGNLFDNAIEASKNSGRKIIRLDVRIQELYLSICMKNTINKSVLAQNYSLQTTKADKDYHGFGTKNIKKIVDKHSGLISYDEENGYFICDILIPI